MLLIILHHCFLRDQISFFGDRILWDLGYLGTSVFFFLSGYGLFVSLGKQIGLTFSYIADKLKKLFLPYIYIWIFFALLSLCGIYNEPLNWHDFISLRAPNRPTWFFVVIIAVYLVTFLTWKFIKKDSVRIIYILLFTSCYIVMARHFGLGKWWYNSILSYPIGLFVSRYVQNHRDGQINLPLAVILLMSLFYFSRGNEIIFGVVFSLLSIAIYSLVTLKLNIMHYVGTYSLIFYFASDVPYRIVVLDHWYLNYPLWITLSFVFSALIIYSERLIKKQINIHK